jgi:hypothetical protein
MRGVRVVGSTRLSFLARVFEARWHTLFMAGGMNRRARGPSIAQRVAATQDTCPARHCWVSDALTAAV